MGESKVCTKCGVRKGLGEFYKEKKARDGHFTVCKKCRDAHVHNFYADHEGRRAAIAKRYRDTHKKQRDDYNQKYHKAHKVEEKKYHHKHHLIHKEQDAKQKREYMATPNGKAANKRRNHKRRARLKATKATLTNNQWTKILTMQHNCCNMCHKSFTVKRPPTTDHIIPVSAGGGLTFENVQALCGPCNSSKQAKLDPQFIQTWL